MADERAKPQDVFSKRSKFYVTSALHTDPEVLANVVRLSSPSKGMVALDVGTGTGHTAMALAPFLEKVIGLDITEEMLQEGRKVSKEKGLLNVEFRIGDAMELPFPDGSFDIVTCRRAAHHFTDIGKAIREMARVLRTGGRLVIDDRSVPDDDEADVMMNRLDILHDPSHVREYRAGEWQKMLAEADMDVVEVQRYTRHLPMSKFTAGLDGAVAERMNDLSASASPACKRKLNYEMKEEPYIDHFFVMLLATKK
ncbi:MAG: hypothetical protein A4E32_00760 [Methanomassiliicoccales archaeon PtaU1.Bin124]|nr:MAG: hypothetical protein A4E32_00760 [Methanomassiliicoccales archaeon PtaU1.Bin124]